jgi:hypothetical protein
MLLLTLAGCGGHVATRSAVTVEVNQRLRSVAEVRRTFAKHGIELSREPFHQQQLRCVALSGDVHGAEINVAVDRSIDARKVSLVLGGGTPHVVTARNVSASWTGRDLPAVETAMKQLR